MLLLLLEKKMPLDEVIFYNSEMVGFGTDPCSTFTLGVSARTGISFGTCQLAFNLLMFLPVIRFDLSRIGIGDKIEMSHSMRIARALSRFVRAAINCGIAS